MHVLVFINYRIEKCKVKHWNTLLLFCGNEQKMCTQHQLSVLKWVKVLGNVGTYLVDILSSALYYRPLSLHILHMSISLLFFSQALEPLSYYFKIVWPCIVTDSLWIRPTDALNYNIIGVTTVHVSGSLSAHHQEFLAVHRLWYIWCDDLLLPGAVSILLLVANCHHNRIKCTTADERLRTPDDGQKGCPKHVQS